MKAMFPLKTSTIPQTLNQPESRSRTYDTQAEPPIAIMDRVLERTSKTKITSPRNCRQEPNTECRCC